MDYKESWRPITDEFLDKAFKEYDPGMHSYLYYFTEDNDSGMNYGKFPVSDAILRNPLLDTLPDRLKGFNPQTTKLRLEWR